MNTTGFIVQMGKLRQRKKKSVSDEDKRKSPLLVQCWKEQEKKWELFQ